MRIPGLREGANRGLAKRRPGVVGHWKSPHSWTTQRGTESVPAIDIPARSTDGSDAIASECAFEARRMEIQ